MSLMSTLRRTVGALIGGFGGYEGAMGNRRLRNWIPARAHVNTLIAMSGPDMLARARHLTRNNGYAANAVEAFSGNIIGAGITPSPNPKTKAAKTAINDLLEQVFKEIDADGLSDFAGFQRRAAREVYVGGECFVRRIFRKASDGLKIPFQLQLLPSEMLPLQKTEVAPNGNVIRQGVEFDARGRRVAYHFYASNPADSTQLFNSTTTVRVPAEDVIHMMDPLDAGQIRGVSRYAPAIVKIFLLDVYDDAELDRKKIAAMHALFIETAEPEFYPPNSELDIDDAGNPVQRTEPDRVLDLQPGMIMQLEPGEKVTTSSPAESGNTYEPFQYRTLLQISAGLGIPYAILTGDMVRANYSNTRAALIEFRRRVEAFQFSVMIFQLCDPVYRWILDVAVLSGALNLAGYEKRRTEYQKVEWLPPKFDWVDPFKDAKAEIIQIQSGLKSRSQAISERGYDAEKVDQQIADDRAREKRLGLTFAQDPQSMTGDPSIDGGPENTSIDGGPAQPAKAPEKSK